MHTAKAIGKQQSNLSRVMQCQWKILLGILIIIFLTQVRARKPGSIFCDHDNENTENTLNNFVQLFFYPPCMDSCRGTLYMRERERKPRKQLENFHWFHCQGGILARARLFMFFLVFFFFSIFCLWWNVRNIWSVANIFKQNYWQLFRRFSPALRLNWQEFLCRAQKLKKEKISWIS